MSDMFLRMMGIKKSFPGVQALNGVDLEVDRGEVLALVGANGAGKSTLMNILCGLIQQDEGDILIEGRVVQIRDPLDAAKYGVAVVHQEFAVLPTLSITDNMLITGYPTRWGFIEYGSAEQRCAHALKRLAFDIHPRTKLQDLSPGDQQIVEIARALLTEPRIIVFDEPTSSLSTREKKRLFDVIATLKSEMVAVIYITHLLDEVFEVCDRVTVLRDGNAAGGGMVKELTYDGVVKAMIGTKEIGSYFRRRTAEVGETVLRVEALNREGALHDINFSIRKGEIVGLWGLLGSGRTELARAIVGLDPIDRGRITLKTNGKTRVVRPQDAMNWVGMVTENRRQEGLLLPMSVRSNMSLANLKRLVSRVWPLVDNNLEKALAKKLVEQLAIAATSIEQPVALLSGGNQQKVVLGRWLQKNPIVYIMDEPTRGLDVGAKAEMRRIIGDLANEGAAILLISSEIDDIMSLGDRYLVMHQGRIVKELPARASRNELISAAAGTS